jgi:transcriptional regulator with XRE-family HTH domain
MPKLGPHRTHPERAASSADKGFQRLGHAIRRMRIDRGWTQEQLALRILRAEGYEVTKQKAYNAKVSRREQGHPTTLRTLTGFALAFGYRNVWDWFADLFRDEQKYVNCTEGREVLNLAATIAPHPDGREIIRGTVARRVSGRYVVERDSDGPTLTITAHSQQTSAHRRRAEKR